MRDKQIEEMARDLHRNRCGGCGEELCEYKIPTNDEFSCIDLKTATALYNAGYRKASDVAREILALVWDAYQTTHYDAEFEEKLDNIEKKYETRVKG